MPASELIHECAGVQQLQRLHPGGLEDDWSDKMAAQDHFSSNQQATFEHYIQVCLRHRLQSAILLTLASSLNQGDSNQLLSSCMSGCNLPSGRCDRSTPF